MTESPKRPTFRDDLCHLARHYLLAISLERRNIASSVIRINDLTKQFETDLTATREQEKHESRS